MRYECPICGEVFNSMVELSKHLNKHQTEKYKCPQCGKIYSSLEDLTACIDRHIIEEKAKIAKRESERKTIANDYQELRNKVKTLIDNFNKAHAKDCSLKCNMNVTTSDEALKQAIINIEQGGNDKNRVNVNASKEFDSSFEDFLKTILKEAQGFKY